MDRSLLKNCIHQAVANGGVITLNRGSNCITFFPVGNTTFKLQGSTDNVTFNDIASSSTPPVDGTNANAIGIELFQPNKFFYVKVVIDAGTCTVIQRLSRVQPANLSGAGMKSLDKVLIDPQIGTA